MVSTLFARVITAGGGRPGGLSWAHAERDASATAPTTSSARRTGSCRRRDKALMIIAAATARAAPARGGADVGHHRKNQEDHEQAGHRHPHDLRRKAPPAARPAPAARQSPGVDALRGRPPLVDAA